MNGQNKPEQSKLKILDQLISWGASLFYRLKIAKKLMLGFSVLLVLLVCISVYAMFNLNRLNEINSSILNSDLPVIGISEKMIDVIIAQELYAQRYLILKSPDMLKQFWQKENEFNLLIEDIRALPDPQKYPVDEIVSLNTGYYNALSEVLKLRTDASPGAADEFDDTIKSPQEKIIAVIKGMAARALRDQNEKTALITAIGRTAFQASAVLCALGLLFSLVAAFTITRNISGAIKELKYATGMISEGKFDHRPQIRNEDELGDLAQAFVTMAERLKQLEEMYLDTSPLTRLPGGIAIENVLNRRISGGAPIAFCLIDIDNFKAYNDRYGYAKGNDLIQATATMISAAVAKFGTGDDFIGHIGGDDFVLISTPDLYPRICQHLIECYDKKIPAFYDQEDQARGYIAGENRQGQEVKFSLASLSIGVVTNVKRKLQNHIQYGEIAAEMKEVAKTVPGSIFMADQRNDDQGPFLENRKLISIQAHQLESKRK